MNTPNFPAGVGGVQPPANNPAQSQALPPTGSQTSGMYSGLNDANASFDSNYIRPCHCISLILETKENTNRKREDQVIIEQMIVASLDDTPATQAGTAPHRPGETAAHFLNRTWDNFLPDLKSALSAWNNLTPDEMSQALANAGTTFEEHAAAAIPQSAYANMFVEVKAKQVITKAGKPFTKISYARRVPAAEVKHFFSQIPNGDELVERLFKDGMLDKLVETEAQVAAQAAQQGGQQ